MGNKINNFCKDCDGRCCYDGVYITGEEEKIISELVRENKDFFSSIPDEFIIDSNWENIVKGRKTATKPKKYKKDFPKHFTKTACVFLDGKTCLLERFAIKNNEDSWRYKPQTCCFYPLQKNDNNYVIPSAIPDKCKIGPKYPGYVSFLPCYKLKEESFEKEFDYVNRLLNKKG